MSDKDQGSDKGGKFEGRRNDRNSGGGEGGRAKQKAGKLAASGKLYIDYKETETLRRLTGANGKISGRKRTGANALEQRMIAQAIKRARYMALVPYQSSSI